MKYEENQGYGEKRGNENITPLNIALFTQKPENTQNMKMKYEQQRGYKGEKSERCHSYNKNLAPD